MPYTNRFGIHFVARSISYKKKTKRIVLNGFLAKHYAITGVGTVSISGNFKWILTEAHMRVRAIDRETNRTRCTRLINLENNLKGIRTVGYWQRRRVFKSRGIL